MDMQWKAESEDRAAGVPQSREGGVEDRRGYIAGYVRQVGSFMQVSGQKVLESVTIFQV